MGRLTYTVKGFALLAKRVMKRQQMPFHSKKCESIAECISLDKKYLHNGIYRTAIAILQGKCRLHWLRGE